MKERSIPILALSMCLWAACGPGDAPGTTYPRDERGVRRPAGETEPGIAEGNAAVADETEASDRGGWALPIPALDYNARQGRAVFFHYCAPCHGAEGRGDGFNAYNLDPKPRNLADPAFQQRRADEDLSAVVRSGGGVAGLSTGMPPWGRTLNERQIHDVVRFLRTLVDESLSPED